MKLLTIFITVCLFLLGAQVALASGFSCQVGLWTADCMPLEQFDQADARISIICEVSGVGPDGEVQTSDVEFRAQDIYFANDEGRYDEATFRSVQPGCGSNPTYVVDGCLPAGEWQIVEGSIGGDTVASITFVGEGACGDGSGNTEPGDSGPMDDVQADGGPSDGGPVDDDQRDAGPVDENPEPDPMGQDDTESGASSGCSATGDSAPSPFAIMFFLLLGLGALSRRRGDMEAT